MMNIFFPASTAWRYLTCRGEPRFASFLAVVSILGVAVGIAALVVVISVMIGFGRDLESKIMGFSPHITIMFDSNDSFDIAKGIEENFREVKDIEPFVVGEVIVQAQGSDGMSPMGAKVLGMKNLPERMTEGVKFFWGNESRGRLWWHGFWPPLEMGVILGADVGYQIGVNPYWGDVVQLIAPFGGLDPLGNPIPARREYQVVGQFESGFYEYDVKYILMKYDEAKRLLKDQGRYGLEITLRDKDKVEKALPRLRRFLGGGFDVSSWSEKNKRLLAALKLERFAMTILLLLVIVIASFSITGVSLMVYFSKMKDLAILKAIGANRGKISAIFLWYGAFIGMAGAVLGMRVGVGLLKLIEGFRLPETYYLDHIPVYISLPLLVVIGFSGVLISLIASVYPSMMAAATDPVDLLRYE